MVSPRHVHFGESRPSPDLHSHGPKNASPSPLHANCKMKKECPAMQAQRPSKLAPIQAWYPLALCLMGNPALASVYLPASNEKCLEGDKQILATSETHTHVPIFPTPQGMFF